MNLRTNRWRHENVSIYESKVDIFHRFRGHYRKVAFKLLRVYSEVIGIKGDIGFFVDVIEDLIDGFMVVR